MWWPRLPLPRTPPSCTEPLGTSRSAGRTGAGPQRIGTTAPGSVFERAGHLPGVHGRAHPPQPFGMIHGPRCRVRGRGHPIDDDGIARCPGERHSRLQVARGAIDDRHAPARPSGVVVPEHHDDMPAGARERHSKRCPSKSTPCPCLAHGEPRLRSHTSIGSSATMRRTSNGWCECSYPWPRWIGRSAPPGGPKGWTCCRVPDLGWERREDVSCIRQVCPDASIRCEKRPAATTASDALPRADGTDRRSNR